MNKPSQQYVLQTTGLGESLETQVYSRLRERFPKDRLEIVKGLKSLHPDTTHLVVRLDQTQGGILAKRTEKLLTAIAKASVWIVDIAWVDTGKPWFCC